MPFATNRTTRNRRRGAVTLELILALPVFVIFIMAIAEFGMFYANMQVLQHAAAVGAREASETSLPSSGPIPVDIVNLVQQDLASSGINTFSMRLEHNVGGGPFVLREGSATCGPASPLAVSPGGDYVRVSVCTPMTELAPNLLKTFGFDIAGYKSTATVVMRHEQ